MATVAQRHLDGVAQAGLAIQGSSLVFQGTSNRVRGATGSFEFKGCK
jgi:hypothetical protein